MNLNINCKFAAIQILYMYVGGGGADMTKNVFLGSVGFSSLTQLFLRVSSNYLNIQYCINAGRVFIDRKTMRLD